MELMTLCARVVLVVREAPKAWCRQGFAKPASHGHPRELLVVSSLYVYLPFSWAFVAVPRAFHGIAKSSHCVSIVRTALCHVTAHRHGIPWQCGTVMARPWHCHSAMVHCHSPTMGAHDISRAFTCYASTNFHGPSFSWHCHVFRMAPTAMIHAVQSNLSWVAVKMSHDLP